MMISTKSNLVILLILCFLQAMGAIYKKNIDAKKRHMKMFLDAMILCFGFVKEDCRERIQKCIVQSVKFE